MLCEIKLAAALAAHFPLQNSCSAHIAAEQFLDRVFAYYAAVLRREQDRCRPGLARKIFASEREMRNCWSNPKSDAAN
jgi:hypothetical protein